MGALSYERGNPVESLWDGYTCGWDPSEVVKKPLRIVVLESVLLDILRFGVKDW